MRAIVQKRIQNLTQSDQLDLSQLHITDLELMTIIQGILQSRATLKKLNLNGNHITDNGAATLATQLASLQHLATLDMQCNQLTIDGVRHLFELKKTHPTLHIPLAGNPIQDREQVLLLEQQLSKRKANFQ